MNDKPLAFIDIEANQVLNSDIYDDYILEYTIFTINSEEPLLKIECKHEYPLSQWVSQLLCKDKLYYFNKKITEKEAYEKILEISKEYDIIAYGNYDQIILDKVAERYSLENIKLIDFSEEVKKEFDLENSDTPSLKNLKYIFDVNFSHENEHDSKWDTKNLRDIYLKFSELKNDNELKERYKLWLKIERLRPKRHNINRYMSYYEPIISWDFNTFIFHIEKIKDDDLENRKYLYSVWLGAYDNNFNLIDYYEEVFSNKNKRINSENLESLKKNFLNKHYYNRKNDKNLFIFNGYFLDEIFVTGRKQYVSVYKIPSKTFFGTDIDFRKKLKLIRIFYSNGEFNKKVDYERLVKEFL